ncbi:uncharacterized protein LOC115624246 isoform X2 [Scaptodrosophila lebanonensis]|nr:uncharacterized protein LOC115624246 isoform X2 [Scaptodrosophila lebanonensis]
MLTRSVRIAGRAHRLTDAQAMEQFRRYPQHVQKSICTGRRERHLGGVYKKISSCLRSLFAQEEKPQLMPTNWGGYLVEPIIYEFDEISGVSPCTDCLLFHRGSPKSIRNHTVNDSAWIFESVQKIH